MNKQQSWLKPLMRFGFVANGLVYITVGILAIQAALGSGGQTAGAQGAFAAIASEPLGQFLVGVIGVGLIGLAIWYVIRGVYDPDNAGSDASGMAKRVGLVAAGLGYGVLAYSALRILWTARASGSGNQVADWTARLMQQPYGIWLIGIAGAIVVGVGIYQLYKAYQTKFRQKLKVQEMSATEIKWGIRAGRIGIAARAVVFGLIGIFLVRAAWQANPQAAGGVGRALQTLAGQPYGPWLLGIVAVGLVAYGLYSAIVLARYRRIRLR
ncbi:MAG: DUF1206 domain-containing protein [Anaerolineaceae bacterium]|nr:DUF1206 domain-containing protein [Anaerolineaceae bacterium]